MTTRAGSVTVSRCVCLGVPFDTLLRLAQQSGWDLPTLVRETGCGGQCGLCRPYLSRMLATGETIFHELLTGGSEESER